MEKLLMWVFLHQVYFEAKCALRSSEELERALAEQSNEAVFVALQNFLTAAANITKALWGRTGATATALAREPLRSRIGVSDDSPLQTVRLRNRFEHFDEYIDDWWSSVPSHVFFDMNIGSAMGQISGVDRRSLFRSFDPETGLVQFWGESYDFPAVLSEIRRIFPVLEGEARKPHWKL